MAYTITSVILSNAVNTANSVTAIVVRLTGHPQFNSTYKKLLPVLYYVNEDDNFISNYTNMTTYNLNGSNYVDRNLYHIKVANGGAKAIPEPGLYLIYNPTDNSNNIGKAVDSAGTITDVDFETLQKYAPWRIVEAVI